MAGQELHEGSIVRDAYHLTRVDLADLGFLHQGLDHLLGLLSALRIGGTDVDGAILLHVNLHARLLDDGADGFAAGADDRANLLRVNLEDGDARRVGGQLRPGLRDDLQHLVQHVEARLPGLGQGLGHDVVVQPLELDIHLHGGDATPGAGHLEVHVPQVVLHPQDVGEDDVFVPLLDQAHGDAGHGGFDGHAGVHQGQGGAADRGHGGRAVGG